MKEKKKKRKVCCAVVTKFYFEGREEMGREDG
jgi:hypothetical protein